jgi:hypothetical protein
MIEEDTPRSFTSPRDDRFFTPRTIARSNSSASNSDEWGSPREFQTPRSYQNSERKEDRPYNNGYHPYGNQQSQSQSKEFYNPTDYYGAPSKQPYYASDQKTNNSLPNPYYNSQAKSAPSSSSAASSRRQYIAEEEENYQVPDDPTDSVPYTFLDYDLEEIFSMARHGRCEEIDKLFDKGLPVDVRDEFGNTLLIIACQNGNKRVAKTVLRRGANINSRNYKGNTPLHYCFHYGYGDSLGQYLMTKVSGLLTFT